MNTRIIAIIIAVLITIPAWSRTDQFSDVQDADQKLEEYARLTASQKLYLHMNKSNYLAGETIWFNAYLVNSVTHQPVTASTNIYAELINSRGVLMEKRVMLAENGVAEGDISLPMALPDGNYYLRAYTDWMKNFPEEFFYEKYLYIENSQYEDMIPRLEVRSNRRFNRSLNRMAGDLDIAFFPEGGELVQGITNRIAFKAVDALGRGLDVEGVVTDDAGNDIARFSTLHSGMGSFDLQPEPGVSYSASVVHNGSRPQSFDLPPVISSGVGLRVDREGTDILLNIYSARSPDGRAHSGNFDIIGHTRGRVFYKGTVSMKDGMAEAVIPENLFESGITHFTVFSGNREPVAERLVYIDRDDSFTIIPNVVKAEHEGQQYLGLQIGIADREGNPVEGTFSMSVLTGDFLPPGSSENILTHYLLSSDLDGFIEKPQEYFDPEKDMETELDHIMMTHGWRRFDWKSVLSGEMPDFTHTPSSTLYVEGRVTDPAKDEPVNNFEVEMKVIDHNDSYTTRTDGRGNFVFDGLDYPDSYRVEISSRRLPGDYPPKIELSTGQVSGFDYVPNMFTKEQQITSRGRDWRRVSDAGRSPYAVTPDRTRSPQSYGVPDQTIYIDRDKVTQRTVYDVLVERGQGVQIVGNQIMFRGPSSINLSSEPMFMLDGVQTSKDNVLGYSPREIERIELFRGTSAAVFGVRGGSGVIIAYSRQAGDRGFQDSKEYMLVGYHTPREFYSDYLSALPSAASGSDHARTIHWEPDLLDGDEEDNTVFFPYSQDIRSMKIVIEGVGRDGGIAAGEFTLEMR